MSEDAMQQHNEPRGSKFAEMFGYVKLDDRVRWDQQRQAMQRRQGAMKTGSKQSLSSMMEFGQMNVQARLQAAHRIKEQEAFDNRKDRVITGDDGEVRVESVSYRDRQTSDLGPEME